MLFQQECWKQTTCSCLQKLCYLPFAINKQKQREDHSPVFFSFSDSREIMEFIFATPHISGANLAKICRWEISRAAEKNKQITGSLGEWFEALFVCLGLETYSSNSMAQAVLTEALKQRIRRPSFWNKVTTPDKLVPFFKDGMYMGWSGMRTPAHSLIVHNTLHS